MDITQELAELRAAMDKAIAAFDLLTSAREDTIKAAGRQLGEVQYQLQQEQIAHTALRRKIRAVVPEGFAWFEHDGLEVAYTVDDELIDCWYVWCRGIDISDRIEQSDGQPPADIAEAIWADVTARAADHADMIAGG